MFHDWYIREILSCVCSLNSQSHSGVNFSDMIRIWVISLEIENRNMQKQDIEGFIHTREKFSQCVDCFPGHLYLSSTFKMSHLTPPSTPMTAIARVLSAPLALCSGSI